MFVTVFFGDVGISYDMFLKKKYVPGRY